MPDAPPHRRRYGLGILLVAPCALFYLAFFLGPLLYLAWESLHSFNLLTGPGGWSLGNYVKLLGDPFYLAMLGETVKLSLAAALLCLVIGYPMALALRAASPRWRGLILLGLLAPLLVSVVVRSFGWLVILGRNGVLNAALRLVDPGLAFAQHTHLFTEGAVLAGLVHVFFPFMVLALYGALQRMDPALVRAARNLGAPPWRAFLEVTLPLSLPGIASGVSTVFALSAGAYVTVAVLGGAKVPVLAVQAYQQSVSLMNWPMGAAIGVILLVTTSALLRLFMARLGREAPR
jgi:putative spermidine/putrescine transport system permease protein